jgi:hypothetical protein
VVNVIGRHHAVVNLNHVPDEAHNVIFRDHAMGYRDDILQVELLV